MANHKSAIKRARQTLKKTKLTSRYLLELKLISINLLKILNPKIALKLAPSYTKDYRSNDTKIDIDNMERWQTKSFEFVPGIKDCYVEFEVSNHKLGDFYIGSFRVKELDSFNKINYESTEYEINNIRYNINF